MSDAEMNQMTLAELEALAARFGAAVATIRQAQALLGGPVAAESGAIAFTSRTPGPPPPQLNAAEVAERERLMRQFKHDGLPDDIKRLEDQ